MVKTVEKYFCDICKEEIGVIKPKEVYLEGKIRIPLNHHLYGKISYITLTGQIEIPNLTGPPDVCTVCKENLQRSFSAEIVDVVII